jgi:shikimate kinase
MTIFLIGFMGCGKSHHGKKLAELWDYSFIDLDDWIVDKARMSIPILFREKGEAYFRQLEAKALRALGQNQNTVIACGGGAPCFHQNITWMNQHGITIFIDTSEELIYERVMRKPKKRPLLEGKSQEELQLFIQSKLQDRRYYYEQAQIILPQLQESDNFTLLLAKKLKEISA